MESMMTRSFARWNTLRNRITLGVLVLFLIVIWATAYVASSYLRTDIRRLLSAQQSATAQMLADQINHELLDRIEALQGVAKLAADQMEVAPKLESLVASRYDLHALFNGGVAIAGRDGKTLAVWPRENALSGQGHMQGDYIATVLREGLPVIGAPAINRSGDPTIPVATSIKDAEGQLVGVISGTINLNQPNFLDPILHRKHGVTGDFIVVAPKHRLVIKGTSKASTFLHLPAQGADPVVDHFISGAEGEAVSKGGSEVDRLVSVRNIPITGWQLVASLTLAEVDTPINELEKNIFGATILLTIFTAGVTWWMLRKQLMPLQDTARQLAALAEEKLPLKYLPVTSNDEIGQLLRGFNRLINVLGEREVLIRQVLDTADVAIFLMNPEGDITLANRAMAAMFGVAEERLTGAMYLSLLPPEEREAVRKKYFPVSLNDVPILDIDRVYCRGDGSQFWGHLTIRPFYDPAGKESGLIGVISNINVRKQAEQALQKSKELYDALAERIPIGIFILRRSASGTFTADYVSPRAAELFGLDIELLRTNPLAVYQVVCAEERDSFMAIHQDAFARHTPVQWQGRVLNESGVRWLYVVSNPDDQENGDILWHGLVEDVTERKEYESQLVKAAHYDALTELPNRVLLGDRLMQAVHQGRRRGKRVAVACLDIDGFKEINDRYGHAVGDRVLVALANCMSRSMREGDTLARLGGDEFVAVMLDLDQDSEDLDILERLLFAASEPVQIADLTLEVSCSIGVAYCAGEDDVDGDQLLRQADQAMYQAKLAGKNRYCIFDADQDRDMRSLHELIEDLRRATEQGEFVLHYQPKVNMATGRLVGAEALIRWQHQVRGLLSPIEFLPMIENHPISIAIGEWVIDSALLQMEEWRIQGLNLPLSVNIGAFQLQHAGFLERLGQQLRAHPSVDPRDLTLEVLESSALKDLTQVSQVIEACRNLGVQFALDDFGTGYSSLTYLKRLKVNQLKIDQSFVRDMLNDPEDLTILEGVIGLAHAFRCEVIAEGVETEAHGELLLLMGCELAQGYGIARPMPAEGIIEWSRSWRLPALWSSSSPANREDRWSLFATTELRAWVVAIDRHVRGSQPDFQLPDNSLGRLEMWLNAEGQQYHGDHPAFAEVGALHHRLCTLAADLCELVHQQEDDTAIARLDELYAVRDALLDKLKTLRSHNKRLADPQSTG